MIDALKRMFGLDEKYKQALRDHDRAMAEGAALNDARQVKTNAELPRVDKLITIEEWTVEFRTAQGTFKKVFTADAVPSPHTEEGFWLVPPESKVKDFIRDWSMTGVCIFGKRGIIWSDFYGFEFKVTGEPQTVSVYDTTGLKAKAEAKGMVVGGGLIGDSRHVYALNRQTAVNRAAGAQAAAQQKPGPGRSPWEDE